MSRLKVFILGVFVFVPLLILEGRMFYLQVVRASTYREQLHQIRSGIEVIPSSRGRIWDRNGKLVALDDRAFDLVVTLDDFERHDTQAIAQLRQKGISPVEIEEGIDRIYKDIQKYHVMPRPESESRQIVQRERNQPYLLIPDIEFKLAYDVEVHPEKYPGLDVQPKLRRRYPYGAAGSHVLGYVGFMNRPEIEALLQDEAYIGDLTDEIGEDGMDLLKRRGVFDKELAGETGVEKYYNSVLRGRIGIMRVERRPGQLGRQRIEVRPAVPGGDVHLTIDIELQKVMEEVLKGINGSAVVMDIRDGSILALASVPSFSSNTLVPPVKREIYQAYVQNQEGKPLLNRAISGEYPIGSIFKVVTALSALESKAITPATVFTCKGRFSEHMDHFKCWILTSYNSTHGELNLEHAIEQSCNVYFYNTGNKAGIDAIAQWSEEFGLGHRTGIDLYGEQDGMVPTKEWRERRGRGRPPHLWSLSDTLSISIGQGYLTGTPVQIARLMALVANDGNLVTPHVMKEAPAEIRTTAVSKQSLEEVRKGLRDVIHGDHGTARQLKDLPIAGKTSTAQVGGQGGTHAWFAGYYPVDAPRYAFVVMVEHGESGGRAAAPRAVPIIQKLIEMDKAGEKKDEPKKE